jgi:hypothetical protein
MIARTGDSEALFLLDWFHHHILLFWCREKSARGATPFAWQPRCGAS